MRNDLVMLGVLWMTGCAWAAPCSDDLLAKYESMLKRIGFRYAVTYHCSVESARAEKFGADYRLKKSGLDFQLLMTSKADPKSSNELYGIFGMSACLAGGAHRRVLYPQGATPGGFSQYPVRGTEESVPERGKRTCWSNHWMLDPYRLVAPKGDTMVAITRTKDNPVVLSYEDWPTWVNREKDEAVREITIHSQLRALPVESGEWHGSPVYKVGIVVTSGDEKSNGVELDKFGIMYFSRDTELLRGFLVYAPGSSGMVSEESEVSEYVRENGVPVFPKRGVRKEYNEPGNGLSFTLTYQVKSVELGKTCQPGELLLEFTDCHMVALNGSRDFVPYRASASTSPAK